MRLWLVAAALFALVSAAASPAAAPSFRAAPTNACLARHHVSVTHFPVAGAWRLGMPVTSYEVFHFDGVPAYVVDSGYLSFAKDAPSAAKAEAAYVKYFVAYDVAKGQSRKTVLAEFKAVNQVVGNVFISWTNFPQTAAAKRILRSCLR